MAAPMHPIDTLGDPDVLVGQESGYAAPRCLRSGFCCTKAPCAFGDWDAEAHRCRHLVESQRGDGWAVHGCAIKDFIETQPGAAYNPAFGSGCCMPLFNDARAAIAAHLRSRR